MRLKLPTIDERRGRIHCKLVAHLLDLRGLRFEGGGEGLNLFLLLRDRLLYIGITSVMTAVPSTFRCSLRNSLSNIAFTSS